jgi:DNA-binding NarL/FixJ family response regulator
VRSPSRTTAWSSTTSTRIGGSVVSGNRRLQPYGRARAVGGVDRQAAADALRALLHRRQAEPPPTNRGRRRIEAAAVIAHLEHDAAVAGSQAEQDPLSEREHEVLRLLALGFTNQEIAKQLFISVRTAETHRAHVMQKLRLQSRAELVRYAIAHGLLDERSG